MKENSETQLESDSVSQHSPQGNLWNSGAYRTLPYSTRLKLLIGTQGRGQYGIPVAAALFCAFISYFTFPTRIFCQLTLDLMKTKTATAWITEVEDTGRAKRGGRLRIAGRPRNFHQNPAMDHDKKEERDTNNSRRIYRLRYRFVADAMEQWTEGECFVVNPRVHMQLAKAGDSMTVKFLPNNPTCSCLEQGFLLSHGYAGGIPAVVLLFTPVIALSHWRARKKSAELIRVGTVATANVTKIIEGDSWLRRLFSNSSKQAVQMEILHGDKSHPVRVKIENGAEYQFVSEKLKQCETIRVLFHPSEMEHLLIINLHLADQLKDN